MKKINLTRREFIKFTGISAIVLTAYPLVEQTLHLIPEINFNNRLFRGTLDGIIQSSSDEGQTWEKMMNFGDQIQVVDFKIANEQLVAKLKFGQHDFLVESDDGRVWRTI